MKGYFKRAGKYRNDRHTLVVSEADVKSKKEFDVFNRDAIVFRNADYFVEAKPAAKKAEKPDKKDFDKPSKDDK